MAVQKRIGGFSTIERDSKQTEHGDDIRIAATAAAAAACVSSFDSLLFFFPRVCQAERASKAADMAKCFAYIEELEAS